MTKATLRSAAAVVAFLLSCAPASAAETVSPLPASDYSVGEACPEPAPGYASCLALELVPETPAARAHSHPLGMTLIAASGTHEAGETCEAPTAAEGCFGLRPEDLHSAYELPPTSSSAQTIAVVDAYNDPTAETDLEAYDKEFGLPECTAENGCFEQVNQEGQASNLPFPKTTTELNEYRAGSPTQQKEAAEAEGWTVEMSLDIETARAICNSCSITLVEAESSLESDMETAEEAAVDVGANEISNSWGGPECVEISEERECVSEDSAAFNHPGTVITASAGDFGYLGWYSSQKGFAEFPASSPHVVAVGGTRLLLSGEGRREKETVWNDGGEKAKVRDGHGAAGGGCSQQFTAQLFQQEVSDWSSVGCSSHRAVADVAADADPYTGLAVHDSSSQKCESEGVAHWCTIGGTSFSSPLIAGVFALAGGSNSVEYPAHTLYANLTATPASLFDVTEGSNGECALPFESGTGKSGCNAAEETTASCPSHLSCAAGLGYDGPTGVGTPNGLAAFQPPAGLKEPEGSKHGGGGSRGAELSAPLLPAGGERTIAGSPNSSQSIVRLTGLALTLKAIIALNTSRPRLAQLIFTFTSNLASSVRVSLQKLVVKRRHNHWRAFGHQLEIAAVAGHNTEHLPGHGVLSRGSFRLTLTPADGAAHSIEFKIG
jgi:Subtilase family